MDKRQFLKAAAAGSMVLGASSSFAKKKEKPEPEAAKPAALPQNLAFLGTDSNGKVRRLSDYAGKTCLISFFTSSCNLCTRDLKLMREFYLNNKARDFVLIGLNIDAAKTDFMEYVHLVELTIPADQRFPMIWRNAPGHEDNFGQIVKQPTHFVLDKNHKLSFKREGTFLPDDWDTLWTQLG